MTNDKADEKPDETNLYLRTKGQIIAMYRNEMKNWIWGWKDIYTWTMCGKWRKWCIPGAILGVLTFIIITSLGVLFKDSPEKKEILFSIFGVVLEPLRLVIKSDFARDNDLRLVVVFFWFMILGALAGCCGRILWIFVRWIKSLYKEAK